MNIINTKENERRLNEIFNSILILLLFGVLFYLVQQCDPEPVRADDDTVLILAQCIRAECDTCRKDRREPAAILHVLRKRMEQWNRFHPFEPRTIADQAVLYCSIFDSGSKRYYGQRASDIRSSTFDIPIHGSFESWDKTRKTVEEFLGGRLSDPTPLADHFGGDMDAPRIKRAGFCVVAKMSNTFWGDCAR